MIGILTIYGVEIAWMLSPGMTHATVRKFLEARPGVVELIRKAGTK
jgi:hypothetical protein